jgi:hypothetical protein
MQEQEIRQKLAQLAKQLGLRMPDVQLLLCQERSLARLGSIAEGRSFIWKGGVGIESYLRDLIQLFNEEKWHWAFYSFREDDWEGMDYELGSGKPPAKYWEYIEQGRMPASDVYKGSSIFNVIQNGLR